MWPNNKEPVIESKAVKVEGLAVSKRYLVHANALGSTTFN